MRQFHDGLPDIGVTTLRQRQVQQQEVEGRDGDVRRGSSLVFTTRYGTPVEPRNVNRSYDARIAKAGSRKITVYDARWTCGTLLADLDVHRRVAMQILRHAQFSIIMEIYTRCHRQPRAKRSRS